MYSVINILDLGCSVEVFITDLKGESFILCYSSFLSSNFVAPSLMGLT